MPRDGFQPAEFTILTVCTGNICRSPLAAMYVARALSDVPQIRVVSAGTRAQDGAGMPDQGLDLARSYGLVGEAHAARYLTERDIESAELVLAMSREHRSAVVSMVPRAVKTTFALREFAALADDLRDKDDRVIEAIDPDDVRGRLKTMVALVASRRGQTATPVRGEDYDVVDPYRRSDEVYLESGRQLVPAAEKVAATLRRAVSLPHVASAGGAG